MRTCFNCYVSGAIRPDLYPRKDAVLQQSSVDRSFGRLHVRLKYDFRTSDLVVHLIEGMISSLKHLSFEFLIRKIRENIFGFVESWEAIQVDDSIQMHEIMHMGAFVVSMWPCNHYLTSSF
jgi:hypothetical protein